MSVPSRRSRTRRLASMVVRAAVLCLAIAPGLACNWKEPVEDLLPDVEEPSGDGEAPGDGAGPGAPTDDPGTGEVTDPAPGGDGADPDDPEEGGEEEPVPDDQTDPPTDDDEAEAPDPVATDCAPVGHAPGGPDGRGGCWPGEANTGVPDGVSLTRYTGPCTLGSGTVTLERVDATSCGILAVTGADVTIIESRVPVIDRTVGAGSVVITDSTADGTGWVGGVLWGSDIEATRVEVTGAQHSVHCDADCTIVDSWLHGQEAPEGSATHNNAFLSNGGSGMIVRHSTLDCSAPQNSADGGCTADLSLFGDFAPISDVTVDANLFVATPSGGYCGSFGHNPGKNHGDDPSSITVTDNVFQRGPGRKCGYYGPATSFLATAGSTWSGNVYDDGAVVNP